jgi:hypothetical protein
MQQDCPDCQRLWREYAAATTKHVGLEKKLRSSDQGSPALEGLSRDVSQAADVRETIRQSIHQHESEAHGRAADATDSEG